MTFMITEQNIDETLTVDFYIIFTYEKLKTNPRNPQRSLKFVNGRGTIGVKMDDLTPQLIQCEIEEKWCY